jgi:hypothetical protein
MACLPTRPTVARKRFRRSRSRRRPRGDRQDAVSFAPGWPSPNPARDPEVRAEPDGGRREPEVGVGFAPGWPLPPGLVRR